MYLFVQNQGLLCTILYTGITEFAEGLQINIKTGVYPNAVVREHSKYKCMYITA